MNKQVRVFRQVNEMLMLAVPAVFCLFCWERAVVFERSQIPQIMKEADNSDDKVSKGTAASLRNYILLFIYLHSC